MARPGVTYIEVANAAEAIQGLGQNPTVDRVLSHLGTGSKSTLAPLLKQWKANQRQGTTPLDLPDDVLEAVKKVHERLQRKMEHTVEQAESAFNVRATELEEQRAATETSLEALQAQHRELEEHTRTLAVANTGLKSTLETAHLTIAKLEAEGAALQTRLREVQSRVQDQKQENRGIREHFEHYQDQMAAQLRRERDHGQVLQQQWEHQLRALTQQLERELKRSEVLEAGERRANHTAEQLRNELDKAQQNQHTLQIELVTKDEALNTLETVVTQLEKRVATFETQCETWAQSNRILETSNQFLEQRTLQLAHQVEQIQEQLSQALEENRQLLHENADLKGQLNTIQLPDRKA